MLQIITKVGTETFIAGMASRTKSCNTIPSLFSIKAKKVGSVNKMIATIVSATKVLFLKLRNCHASDHDMGSFNNSTLQTPLSLHILFDQVLHITERYWHFWFLLSAKTRACQIPGMEHCLFVIDV